MEKIREPEYKERLHSIVSSAPMHWRDSSNECLYSHFTTVNGVFPWKASHNNHCRVKLILSLPRVIDQSNIPFCKTSNCYHTKHPILNEVIIKILRKTGNFAFIP